MRHTLPPALLRRVAPRLLPLLLAAGVAACGGAEPEDRSAAADSAEAALPPSVRAPVELSADEQLAEDVRAALAQAPALSTENIDIVVTQKQVFLMGEVSAPHLRDEAVAVAGEVPGVRSVQSKINVARR